MKDSVEGFKDRFQHVEESENLKIEEFLRV